MTAQLGVTWAVARDGAVCVTLRGELDMATGPLLESTLHEAEAGAPALLVVDLRGLGFMDSTGLNLLLQAEGRAREGGRRLLVVRGPEPVQRVFVAARLEQRLTFVDDPAESPASSGAG